MAASAKRVVLVTGANKGIGYHIVNQLARADAGLTVLLGARDAAKGAEAVQQLALPNVQPITIDIDEPTSIAQAAAEVKQKYDGLDVLLNNAGMAFKGEAFDENVVVTTLKTNHYGTLNTINAFLPLLRPNGKVINVSSASSVSALRKMSEETRKKYLNPNLTIDGLNALLDEFRAAVAAGNHQELGYPTTAYGMSKVGVSIMTRILAKQMTNGQTINCGCPGWCRTDMAGDRAPRSAEEGAATFSHIALLPSSEMPNGEFWEDKKVSSLTREA